MAQTGKIKPYLEQALRAIGASPEYATVDRFQTFYEKVGEKRAHSIVASNVVGNVIAIAVVLTEAGKDLSNEMAIKNLVEDALARYRSIK